MREREKVAICDRCRVIYFVRAGCKSCKGLPQPSPPVRLPGTAAEAMIEDQANEEAQPPGLTVSPDAVLLTKIPVMRHVPKAFRIQWCVALTRAISRLCDCPEDPCRQAEFFGIAKALLHPPKRGGTSRPRRQIHELQ